MIQQAPNIIEYTDSEGLDTIESAVIRNMPESEYRKLNRMNQTSLKAWSVSIPDGLCGSDFNADESTSASMGKGVHCLLLEGEDAFNERYVTGGPINPTTKTMYGRSSKKFQEWLKEQSGEYLTEREMESVRRMAEAIQADEFTHNIITMPGSERELTILWTETIDGVEIRCKAKLDWWHDDIGITDLKSVDDPEAPAFSRSIAQRDWHLQAFLYPRGVYMSGLYHTVPRWAWIALQNHEPYKIKPYIPDETVHNEAAWMINCGRAVAWRGLKNYAHWVRTKQDRIPNRGFESIGLPSWAWADESTITRAYEEMK